MTEFSLTKVVKHIRIMAKADDNAERSDRQILDSFCIHRDEPSFSMLVSRYGPMVLRICRRVLQHEQDAEDAFQAVFLVLASRSTFIRKRDSLAGWLHGVSYRTALKAKRSAARRLNHERRLPALEWKPTGPSWDDVQSVLDEEVQRLPKQFRAAFVLCIVRGMSCPRAADELGIPKGTAASRVARARQILRARLSRRGIQLGALLAALSVAETADCAIPACVASILLRNPASVTIPTRVAKLTAALTREMLVAQARTLSLAMIAIAAAIGLGYPVLSSVQSQEPGRSRTSVFTKNGTESQGFRKGDLPKEEHEQVQFRGRVIDPQGRPGAGASIYMTIDKGSHEPVPSTLLETADPDGRFHFKVSKEKFGELAIVVAATAPGYAAGWTKVAPEGDRTGVTIQLSKDDGPIEGRIVDLEGNAVVGAALTLVQLSASPNEDLGPWLEACRNKENYSLQLESKYLNRYTVAVPLTARTDSAGRVRINGLGGNRLVRMQLDGPTIVSQQLTILTRPGEPFQVMLREGNPQNHEPGESTVYYGSAFRLATAPCKPIVGVLRDKDSGKPLVGFEVLNYGYMPKRGLILGPSLAHMTTDDQGRYCLNGVPKRMGNLLAVLPNRDLPYCSMKVEVPDTPGLEPVSLDVAIKKGVWIQGRVVDKETEKPIKALVEYFSLGNNPSMRDYPGFDGVARFQVVETKPDGSYRIAGIPGPGFIAVWRPQGKRSYISATRRQDEFGIQDPPPSTAPYQLLPLGNYVAFARVEPVEGAAIVRRDVTLEPEREK